ncbi:MAG TPA: tRNA threonylcarbamoyladenosine biosynthesis protein RimN [Thiothrix sp.]|nr:tRNA threonylcarbamoyladenosine biosynthesis protein RimN [Thiothrix sp.]
MLVSPHIDDIASLIKQKGIIAYPTEAVFGLGGDPQCEYSIQRILTIKQRSASKGLILIAASLKQLAPYIQPLTNKATQRIQAIAPHPTTWLVPASQNTSSLLTGEHKTLAIRLTQHPSCIALCNTLGHPLISTSANPTGLPPAITINQVKTYFPFSIDGILKASLGHATSPSEIRDLRSNQRIR